MASLAEIIERGTRLEQLIALRQKLAEAIDECDSKRDLATLSRQFRETLSEIAEIEGAEIADDEIGSILQDREAEGKPGAVRKNRAEV